VHPGRAALITLLVISIGCDRDSKPVARQVSPSPQASSPLVPKTPTLGPTMQLNPSRPPKAPREVTACDFLPVQVPPTSIEPSAVASSIVYADRCDLWLLDASSGKKRRLTKDGDKFVESLPRFRTPGKVTYIAVGGRDGTLHELDLATSKRSTLWRSNAELVTYAWNSSHDAVALITVNKASDRHTLRVFSPATRRTTEIRRFSRFGGRGGREDDEVTIAWSPDGNRILVVDTYLDTDDCAPTYENCVPTDQTLFVLDLAGKDVIRPRKAMMGRWDTDGKSVIYRDWRGNSGRWHTVDVKSGSIKTLPLTSETLHLATAPGGRLLAYDDGGLRGNEFLPQTSLFMFDREKHRERLIGKGYAGALWLSLDEILVSVSSRCRPVECEVRAWSPTGRTVALRLRDGRTRPFPVASTLNADVLYR
jgi:hypothetical protein